MESLSLNQLAPGQRARVVRVLPGGPLHRRLLDIGLIPGTPVICLHVSPAGDPVAYGIRGAVIALRQQNAADVLVSPESGASPWE